MDTRRGNEPAWTTHARRIIPGQEIIVNRDDDEAGDMGLRNNALEKTEQSESAGSSSSRTAAPDVYEMQDRSEGDKAGSEGDRAGSEGDGPGTPPLAEYREGHHLIIERKVPDSEEVRVA